VVRKIGLRTITEKQHLICTDMQPTIQPHSSSFRDPSGFVFQRNGVLYRQVNKVFKDDFDHFIKSGCYDHFVKNKWLIPHEEVSENLSGSDNWYKTLKPKRIPFISYPYEWSFDMLKDAAILSLRLAKEGIAYGVMIKDATPYNIQWSNGRAVFIDTISFEKYDSSKPWIAYRQFCENFAACLNVSSLTTVAAIVTRLSRGHSFDDYQIIVAMDKLFFLLHLPAYSFAQQVVHQEDDKHACYANELF
jgi:hypothetical protein